MCDSANLTARIMHQLPDRFGQVRLFERDVMVALVRDNVPGA
jgi:hypothetical protein